MTPQITRRALIAGAGGIAGLFVAPFDVDRFVVRDPRPELDHEHLDLKAELSSSSIDPLSVATVDLTLTNTSDESVSIWTHTVHPFGILGVRRPSRRGGHFPLYAEEYEEDNTITDIRYERNTVPYVTTPTIPDEQEPPYDLSMSSNTFGSITTGWDDRFLSSGESITRQYDLRNIRLAEGTTEYTIENIFGIWSGPTADEVEQIDLSIQVRIEEQSWF